jgi:hypothetical protein
MECKPIRFISEAIEVQFDQPPLLEKKPPCPDRFIWHGETFRIVEKLSEWQDFTRRGRMAKNIRPTRAARAQVRGSWGVGRFYFRVVTTPEERIFDLYYDRTPKDVDTRKGKWILHQELQQVHR